jgi:outer membrane protein
MMPSLTLGGNISSNWSDVAKTPDGFITQRVPQSGVFINGESALFEVETEIPTALNPIPYGRQLDNNIGYGLGATLSIPIFNNYRNKNGVERAKINVINSSIESDQIKQTLKTNIQNALTSAKASRKSLVGAEAAALAAQVALENANRRSALGSLSNFEYLSARNRSDAAQSNLLIAKYDFYFKIKIIEYYLGRGIRLN